MARAEGVLAAWRVLEVAGLARPWRTDDEIAEAATVWSAVLADVSDERLAELTIAWLRSPEARFGRWPLPGALLAALPDPASVDDADEAWSEALALLSWRGRERCPGTVAELEDLRCRLAVAAQAAETRGDVDRARRARAHAARLPRPDSARTEALLAGVRACDGWRGLGSCDESQIVAHRASFRAAYRAHRQRGRITEHEAAVEALLGRDHGRFEIPHYPAIADDSPPVIDLATRRPERQR